MITDTDITDALRDHCLVFSTRTLPRGHIRVDTKLLYPDGAAICLFVERGLMAKDDKLGLSDFGKTLEKLAEYQVDPWWPDSRIKAIRETVESLGVSLIEDRLRMDLDTVDELQDGIIAMAQACLRSACMIFTRRASATRTLAAEVMEIVRESKLTFESPHKFIGPYHKHVRVDYRIKGPSKMSSILRLGGTHAQANEILRKWVDLKRIGVSDQLATVYDEKQPVERSEDLTRLQEYSSIFPLGDREGLTRFLRQVA